jgi:hypothetical protein
MEPKQKQSYSLEFRAEAVKVVLEQGLSLAEAARRLAIPKGTRKGAGDPGITKRSGAGDGNQATT